MQETNASVPSIKIQAIEFFPDGKRIAYMAQKDGMWHLYAGKKQLDGPFIDVGWHLNCSPDGETIAYSATKDGKWYLYAGKERIGPFHNVWQIFFSPDGKMLEYTVLKGRYVYKEIFMDGKSYIGSFEPNNRIVYLDGERIMLREAKTEGITDPAQP